MKRKRQASLRTDDHRRVILLFEDEVCRIGAERREPTFWEGRCLFSALAAIAMEDYLEAEALIQLTMLEVPANNPIVQLPSVTCSGLRAGLAQLLDQNPTSSDHTPTGWWLQASHLN